MKCPISHLTESEQKAIRLLEAEGWTWIGYSFSRRPTFERPDYESAAVIGFDGSVSYWG